ncbi:MAG: hypothetical protein ACYDIE_02730 [Candidatus Krumholzibacteriia bacterium]
MSVDRNRVAAGFARTQVGQDEDGLLAAFGIPLTRLPADLWHVFAARLLDAVGAEVAEDTVELLADSAQQSGYHLGYGILTSEAWRESVAPSLERLPDDLLHGACAAFAACGWPEAEIVDFAPGERLTLRASRTVTDSPDRRGADPRPQFALLRGMAAALMDLACADQPYPEGLGTYRCATAVPAPDGVRADFVVTRA